MNSGISATHGQRALRALLALVAACATLLLAASSSDAAWTQIDPFDVMANEIGEVEAGFEPDGSAAETWVLDSDVESFKEFSPDGQSPLGSFTVDYTFASGELSNVSGVAVDNAGGMLYVADEQNHRVVALDVSGGSPSAVYQAPGYPLSGFSLEADALPTECPGVDCPANSTDPGEFSYPLSIAYNNGEVYVLDNTMRIQVFDRQLEYLRTIINPAWEQSDEGFPGRDPASVIVNSATGNLLVAMSGSNGVEEYTPAGAFVRTISLPVSWLDEIEVDPVNNVLYVVDQATVQAFDLYNGASLGAAADLNDEFSDTWITTLAIQPLERVLMVGYNTDLGDGYYTNGVNRYSYEAAPTCTDATAATQAPTPVTVSLNCNGGASPNVSYTISAQPGKGTLSGFNSATGSVTYTPNAGSSGTDTFKFRGHSPNGASAEYTATITVAEEVPVIRKTANLERSSGEIWVKLPGTDTWTRLEKDALVPVGTIIDAADGYCVLTFANADGSLYSGTFWGGVFQILQTEGDEPYAVLKLRDDEFPDAPSQAGSAAAAAKGKARAAVASRAKSRAAAKKGKKKNKLWGKGKGKFRTSGDGSNASVRGTRWSVTNYTNGTVTQVTEGVVVVRDFYRKKTITLRRGQSYFADKNWKKNRRATARAKPRFTG